MPSKQSIRVQFPARAFIYKMEQKQENKESEPEKTKKSKDFYNRNYKLLLIIPVIIFILSIGYMSYFYSQNGDFIKKDVSLTGGTTVTIFSSEEIDVESLRNSLSDKLEDFSIRELSDFRSGKQAAVIVEGNVESSELKSILEGILGYELTEENSSIEFSGPTLSQGFYHQLIYAIILSFAFMAMVVLFIFGGNWRLKIFLIATNTIPYLLFRWGVLNITLAISCNLIILILSVLIYFRTSIPSAAVVLSAFADILMTLALVNFLGIRVSSAGIVAFLMLIGYSVDTDIMLTTRLLKRKESGLNENLRDAFRTGITMTITSIVAITVALVLTQSFSEILKQIFTILLIGLIFDILNTWITNASILKWYLEARK